MGAGLNPAPNLLGLELAFHVVIVHWLSAYIYFCVLYLLARCIHMANVIIGVIIGIVTAVVGFVIVDSVIAAQSWNSTLSSTIATYVVPIGLLSTIAMAAYMSS